MADLGVHRVGEVDRRRAVRQGDDVALRREDVDLARADLEPQRLEELPRVTGLALPVEKLSQPGHLAERVGLVRHRGAALAADGVLVLPVRRHAQLGPTVHQVRADLDLDRLAARADHRRVQRLVHVELGHRDVVLEPPRHRVPPGVQGAEDGVAVADALDQDAHGHQVVDVGEVAAPHHHLLVDGVVVLRPPGDGRLDLGRAQVVADLVAHLVELLLARRRAVGHEPDDLVVDPGVEGRERQVLELPLDRVHAEPVGQRRVDLERLARLALGRGLRDVLPGAGVVQPVGQLDHQDADVARHRDHHLADGLGLGRLAVGDLVELGDAVDQAGDLVAELGPQLVEGVVGVLDGVVQQRGRQRRHGHAELGQDRGHRHRVGDVRVAALAPLAAVGALGDDVRALERGDVGLGVVGPHRAQQRLDHRRGAAGRGPRAEAGDPGPQPDRSGVVRSPVRRGGRLGRGAQRRRRRGRGDDGGVGSAAGVVSAGSCAGSGAGSSRGTVEAALPARS